MQRGNGKVYAITETKKTALHDDYDRLIAMVQDGVTLKEGENNE
jgi:hypothetical protein